MTTLIVNSYDSLVAAVGSIAEDSSSEFIAFLPQAINNAELRLTKELDSLGLIIQADVTVNPSVAVFTKPIGYRVGRSVVFTDPTSGRTSVLRKKTDDYLYEYWPHATSVGTPVYYADIDNTTFKIAPCTSAASIVSFTFERRPDALSSTNQTNYFTDFTADCLYYATVLEIATWARNDTLYSNFNELYQASRASTNNEGKRARRDDGTPIDDPEGQNTLLEGGASQ